MKNAVRRIRNDGESEILRKLSDRLDNEKQPAPIQLKEVTVQDGTEWTNLDTNVGIIVVDSQCCNEVELDVLDMGHFVNLREWRVGDKCFEKVEKLKLIGMKNLERVVVGRNSFTKAKCDRNRHFYLKDCGQLKELKIGTGSFNDFYVCEIANVPSLEMIEMGTMDDDEDTFCCGSGLELKSDGNGRK